MKTISRKMTKNIKLVTGEEIERVANWSMNLPETVDEAVELVNGSTAVWVAYGMVAYAQRMVANKLVSIGAPDNETDEEKSKRRKLARQFKEAFTTLKDVMDMTNDEATAKLMKKEKFASLKDMLDAAKATNEAITIDFAKDPLPPIEFETDSKKKRLFTIGEEDDTAPDNDGDEKPAEGEPESAVA